MTDLKKKDKSRNKDKLLISKVSSNKIIQKSYILEKDLKELPVKNLKKQKGGQNIINGIENLITSFEVLGKSIGNEITLLINTRKDLMASSEPPPGDPNY